MNKLLVNRSRLVGEVRVSGAKNSVLRLLAATILTDEEVTLTNFPSGLSDVQIHCDMLRNLGKVVRISADGATAFISGTASEPQLIWDGRSIRNTLLILGAQVAKNGQGAVPLPGGCQLGDRNFDLHQLLLEKLGATVWVADGKLWGHAPNGLTAADIHLPIRSTGATENAILAGSLARGRTTIWNPHVRPEILDLVAFMNGIGGCVRVYGQERIEVQGTDQFSSYTHKVIPDNMEAITWLIATVMTGGEVEIVDFPLDNLEVALAHLKGSGTKLYVGDGSVVVRGGVCYPIEVSTGPHPGINSDVQPLLAAYGTMARGVSKIVDLRFPGRYAYSDEMRRMGVNCTVQGNQLVVQGAGGGLSGAVVRALDLRAGAALLACGLVADGETEIVDAWQIGRGYERFPEKLRALGAHVRVVEN